MIINCKNISNKLVSEHTRVLMSKKLKLQYDFKCVCVCAHTHTHIT